MLTVYTTNSCGFCTRLKLGLDRVGIVYTEINLEDQPDAADVVMAANGGNQVVPTVVFPDGTAMTNPSVRDVRQKLIS